MKRLPYPGLRSFNPDEEDIFFGREEQVGQILDKLYVFRFVAVTGRSGCGKSSLVDAGVQPALRRGLFSGISQWRIAKMRPGAGPMSNLAKSLIYALGNEPKIDEQRTAFLLATLRRGPIGLIQAIKETPIPDSNNLLIIVDQFEEIFRFYQQYDQNEAEAFVNLLIETIKTPDVPVYVIMTMRSDFLGDCSIFEDLPEILNKSQFLTPRLRREQCKEVIIFPAKMFGGDVDSKLVNRLLNDSESEPDQLPVLQHCLMRMWTQAKRKYLTLNDYESCGGLEKALSIHADEAYNTLNEVQKKIAEVMFRCLSERSLDKRDNRRSARVKEIADVAQVLPDQIYKVVEVFRYSGRSFITPPLGTNLTPDTIIDISHESLIRQWSRLKKWADDEAEAAEMYNRLEETAVRWKNEKAALWRTPDLDFALKWKQEHDPKKDWALRYGRNYDLAMEFLDESEKLKIDEEENKKQELKERAFIAFNMKLTQILSSITGGLVGRFDIKRLLDQVVKTTLEILRTDVCLIFLIEHEKDKEYLVLRAGSGYARKYVGIANYDSREDVIGCFAKYNKKEQGELPKYIGKEIFRGIEIRKGKNDNIKFTCEQNVSKNKNMIVLSLNINDRCLGFIKVENNKMKSRDGFNEDDMQYFETIANVVALAIENARLVEKTEKHSKEIAAKAAHRIYNQATNLDDIEMTLEAELGEIDQRYCERLNSIVSHLSETTINLKRMTEEFKNYGQPLKLDKTIADINQIIETEVGHAHLSKNIIIDISFDPNIPKVNIDAPRFAEAAKELLRNSIKAILKGKNASNGRIKISTHLITNKRLVSDTGQYLPDVTGMFQVKIEDNGPGFADGFPAFEPFHSTDPDSNGLGLAMVKELIEAHGGTIKALPGQGATIEMEVPIA